MSYFIQNSGSGSSQTQQSHTSGSTVTASDTTNTLIINPSAVLPALTFTLPTNAYPAGTPLFIKFGGSISYPGEVVTALTVSAPSGLTIDAAGLTPTSAIAGDTLAYARSGTVWTRLQ